MGHLDGCRVEWNPEAEAPGLHPWDARREGLCVSDASDAARRDAAADVNPEAQQPDADAGKLVDRERDVPVPDGLKLQKLRRRRAEPSA
jgi:hypothetical protein